MNQKVGRNDPCPCGSGRKYKSCCWKSHQSTGKKTFSAKVLSNTVAQIGKTFSNVVHKEESKSS